MSYPILPHQLIAYPLRMKSRNSSHLEAFTSTFITHVVIFLLTKIDFVIFSFLVYKLFSWKYREIIACEVWFETPMEK
ncbi:unnamed protein product [Brugia timori]|uniref:Ovule protein n=1 Tax=Brugia timori TaxID=42155 RepID=A0A0R3QTX0_9BILA|nr:unnamed protein product [Brugia timori]